ncbi:DUF2309 domain-containing protein [Natronoarchaeum mannanilyticum]|uniref:Probable inorganic carbon transporter subunit DabA n=2 Tax=Natronoarchaeum mannanilyticum TaxID=926360 RepID=A0AAV3TD12_9EURY
MTLEEEYLDDSIERAAEAVGSVWPLHSFVTANPLAGFEDRPFEEAVAEANDLFGGRGYPDPATFRRAWEDGRIDPDVLRSVLDDHGVDDEPSELLDEMAADASETSDGTDADPATETVDRILTKWLAKFLDEGLAHWSMPNRSEGFYAAWRQMAPLDDEIPNCGDSSDLPETPTAAIEAALSEVPQGRWEPVFERHLAALPGWTGFLKQRADADGDPWQSAHPISLTEYLAVRLTLADLLDAPIEADEPEDGVDPSEGGSNDEPTLADLWLTAWEESYRRRLLDDVERSLDGSGAADGTEQGDDRPASQLVFCIDTRSEIIRRHIEAQGHHETHGYAGFFGVPMRYSGYDSDVEIDACPPIVDPEHRIEDRPSDGRHDHAGTYDTWRGLVSASRNHLQALKTNVAAAFTFVEGAGTAYGAAMASRTLAPSAVRDLTGAVDERLPSVAEFCSPTVDRPSDDGEGTHEHAHGDALPRGMTLEEKVEYAKSAFELMGWEQFARLVVFTGHASETTNNPFESSLDCGACAGNPGGPSARVLAAICNDPEVKAALRDEGIDVPEDTVFLAAEHNTTTDEIELFDGEVPESHREDVERLREDLDAAREAATAERAEAMRTGADDSVRETERRAADWAETRPEWGLSGNASFVIGPRDLTEGVDLDGRAFLHSYDWSTDPDGDALEAIVTGPLVVTQWINNQYYFATVDNGVYGSGSKVTHNQVGNVGVYQGNGGDLMSGLPLQSLNLGDEQPYHQPLRLQTVIHAPTERVTEILREHEEVKRLFDNGWIDLSVMDPTKDDDVFHYEGDLEWEPKLPVPVAR